MFPSKPFGDGLLFGLLNFFGQPIAALLVGLALACTLLKSNDKRQEFHDYVADGLVSAAPILLITGAGGAFGAILKVTPLGDYLGTTLSALGIGLFMPFVVAAALKSAQPRWHWSQPRRWSHRCSVSWGSIARWGACLP